MYRFCHLRNLVDSYCPPEAQQTINHDIDQIQGLLMTCIATMSKDPQCPPELVDKMHMVVEGELDIDNPFSHLSAPSGTPTH